MSFLAEFHFVRPFWLLALIPAIFFSYFLFRRLAKFSAWRSAIDPELIPALLVKPSQRPTMNPLPILVATWIISIVALAGPTWEKIPQPIVEREDALVIILDLTWSMYAGDETPNRLVNAKRKIQDILKARAEGVTALIVFSGDAHAVSPLTDDTKTILALLPSLGPEIMPAPGSRLAPALNIAKNLFQDAGVATGQILIITDEIRDPEASLAAARALGSQYVLSIMVAGTDAGAPIKLPVSMGETFLKDDSGSLIIPKVEFDALTRFAKAIGANLSRLDLLQDDLAPFLEPPTAFGENFRVVDRDFDLWREFGPYLIWLLVPLVIAGFRRGWLWMLPIFIFIPPEPAQANLWQDLWATKDQQGQALMDAGEPAEAATRFEDQSWQSAAHYRSENYEAAAKGFARQNTADDHYNRGNALAKAGDLSAAVEAYTQSLEINPSDEDAAFNKALVEQLLEQQSQEDQSSQSDEGEEGNDQDQTDESQSGQNQNGEDEETSKDESQSQANADEETQDDAAQEQQQSAEETTEDENESEETNEIDPSEALSQEESQALDQWLKRVPDDPGGLLRRKFEQQFEERVRQGDITREDFERNW